MGNDLAVSTSDFARSRSNPLRPDPFVSSRSWVPRSILNKQVRSLPYLSGEATNFPCNLSAGTDVIPWHRLYRARVFGGVRLPGEKLKRAFAAVLCDQNPTTRFVIAPNSRDDDHIDRVFTWKLI